jgi:hypothetical protein
MTIITTIIITITIIIITITIIIITTMTIITIIITTMTITIITTIIIIRRKKKYLWFRFPTDPIFFCRPYYFFNAIDRATLFSPGGCRLLPKWHLLSH